jgi:hypothetical protein
MQFNGFATNSGNNIVTMDHTWIYTRSDFDYMRDSLIEKFTKMLKSVPTVPISPVKLDTTLPNELKPQIVKDAEFMFDQAIVEYDMQIDLLLQELEKARNDKQIVADLLTKMRKLGSEFEKKL